MSKLLKPETVLDAPNAHIRGITATPTGDIRSIRAEFVFDAPQVILARKEHIPINPIELAWERQPACL
jgi:hypothetical protein